MKKINYILYILLAMFFVVGCDDDTVKEKEEEAVVLDYGAVEALFETRAIRGEVITEIAMGDTVSLADISNGRPDVRTWTVTGADGSVIALDESKVHNFHFPKGDMDYSIKLNVERTSDGESDELYVEDYIHVNKIDVLADFITNGPVDKDGAGDYTVGRTLPLTLLNKSKGVPDDFEWEFEEGTPVSSEGNDETVVFNKDGVFEVTLTATRSSDGSTDQVTKLIRVIQEYMDIVKSTVDNRTIILKYDQPIMEDPTAAKDDISVDIYTAAGGVVSAAIESISSSNVDSTLTIVIDQDTYSDDVVTLSYDAINASLISTDPAYIARTMDKTHAVDINNMLFHGNYEGGFESFIDKATNLVDDQGNRSKYTFEVEENITFSGNKSGYFGIGSYGDAGAYADILQNVNKEYHPIEVGTTYQIGLWIYVEEMAGASLAKVGIYWRYGAMSIPWWQAAAGNGYNFGEISNTDIGRWIYVTGEVGTGSLSGDTGEFMFRIGDNAKCYLDNMKMYPSGSFRARP
ncbi:PKD domain-containing protein [Labilibacter marinus]|uniref:PKD domain-containing protein n=1 Tax=Labilibacter marinus TaxID=1477105 RepID=UPI001179D718|nr:hypothetical protein [Labilibacter marinus]